MFFKIFKLYKIKKQAILNGLYKSQSENNCTSCLLSIESNGITGLKCSFRVFENGDFLDIPLDYKCESFQSKEWDHNS